MYATAEKSGAAAEASGPGLVDFQIAEPSNEEAEHEQPQIRLPLTVLALDALGKFAGPQFGHGTAGRKGERNGRNGASRK
jgi:hypothetical protein